MDIRGLRFTDLSQSEEELFVKWFDLFAKKDKYNELYIQLHLSIKNGDDSELTNKEREMLNTLFESQKINRENILYYYRLFTLISGFKEVIVENIPFFEKFDYVSIDKVVNSYIQTLNEEDKSIIKKNYLYVRDEIIRLVVEERLLLLLTAHMFNEAEEFYVSYGTLYSEHKYRELKNKYLNEKKELVKKELSELLNRSCFEDFKTKIEGNNKFFTKTEIDSLQKKYDERFALYVFNCIEAHINNIEFEQANIVLKLNENILNAEQLLELKLLYEKKLIKHVEESIQQIEILIQHDNFEEAVIFYNNNAYVLSSCNLKKEVLEYITHIKKWNAVVSELELFDFNQADLTVNNYFNYDFNKNGYYEGTKSYFIREYFKNYFSQEKMPFLIDEEQAKAISIQNENILVTARAGSGKTRVIVAKILYLLETKGFSWDSILVLAFNRNVPLEIQDRLQHQVLLNSYPDKYKKIDVAQTFHKVARSYSDYRGEILANKKTHFIRLVIEYLKENDNSFSERVYNFFRKENHTIEKKAYRDPEDYYTVIRSSKLRTLNGEYVKSKGEKWIADFLFEHGIQYEYEREFFLQYLFQNKDVLSFNEDLKLRLKPFIGEREKTIPDFYLPDFNLLIEHWGINENEESEDVKNEFTKKFKRSWYEYKAEMEWKRKFWHKWRKKLNSDHWAVASIKEVNALLETSVVDIKCTREEFEMKLEKMFLAVKVPVKKRKKQELINDVWRKSIDNFSILVESFINRYQQKYFDLEVGFQDLVKMCNNEREREFLELGFIIKKEYERILKMISKPKIFKRYDQCYIDFNQLLVESIKYIEEGKADFEIKKIRILMIDEYQDFSKLFVKLVEAIRSRNEEIKLFCVGDNWQSINRFAGSVDSYYMNFRHNFDNSSTVEVSTNYRSLPYIINVTNEFMLKNEFQGNPAKFFKSGIQKSVMIHDIEGLINNKENEEYLQLFIDEDGNKESKHILKAAYLKQCADIIKQNPTKDVLILHRMNRFINMQLKVFQNKLKKYFDSYGDSNILYDFDRKVSVKTMHSSKGSEADVVIILEAVNGIIPMIHPDNQLFSVFGETPRIVLDDEKKLFYVAMTRAKNELHILTENKIKSDFLIGLW